MWWNSIWSCIHYLGGSQDRAVKNQGTSGFVGTFRSRTKTTFPRQKEVIPNMNFLASYSRCGLQISTAFVCFAHAMSAIPKYTRTEYSNTFPKCTDRASVCCCLTRPYHYFRISLYFGFFAPMHHMSRIFDCVCILLLTPRLLCIMQIRLHTLLLRTLTHQPMSPVSSEMMIYSG